jgi:hypothetical protein
MDPLKMDTEQQHGRSTFQNVVIVSEDWWSLAVPKTKAHIVASWQVYTQLPFQSGV